MTAAANDNTRLQNIAGVNVAGYLNAESGIGVATRGYITALKALGVPVALNNFEAGLQSRTGDKTFTEFASNNPYPINLICVNADQIPAFKTQFGEGYFEGKYNIGVWWWELPDFPEDWWQSFVGFDEIWVGSVFVQQSLARYSPVPVVCVPPSVVAECAGTLTRSELGIADSEFVFLSMFDFLSTYERKNPRAIIEAFKRAFPTQKDVRLVLKFINGDKHVLRKTEIEKACDGLNVLLLDRYLSAGENQDLVGLADCYVSLHRAEGLGLPIAEAMLQSKPVIATGWSGNMDFTTVSNSCLISYSLVANEEEAPPYKVGEFWAEANVDHAAECMKRLFVEEKLRSELGKRAAIDVRAHFGAEAVQHNMASRLIAINSFYPDLNTSEKTSDIVSYQIDKLSEQRLQMIERQEESHSNSEGGKGIIRRVLLPVIERAGYLNSIYAQLIRKLLFDNARSKTRAELLETKTRVMLAQTDARLREVEGELRSLKEKLRDSER